MESPYAAFLAQLPDLCAPLAGEARSQGKRVVEICESLNGRIRSGGALNSAEEDGALRVELGRLVEYLSRRGSQTIPLATAGRAALADLAGDTRAFTEASRDCIAHIQTLGL